MRRLIFMFLFIPLAASTLAAQRVASEAGVPRKSAEPPADSLTFTGRKALLFLFDGLKVSGGLGGKYWIDETLLFRVTATASFGFSDYDRPIVDSTDWTSHSEDISYTLMAALSARLGAIERFVPYAGIETGVSWYSSTSRRTYLSGTWRHGWNAMDLIGSVHLGVEYFLTDRISFSAEQKLTGRLSRSDTYSTDFKVLSSTSSLMLGVYL